MAGYAMEFMDACAGEPFCCFVSPQPPHWTPFKFAPDTYYERLPEPLTPPPNVPAALQGDYHENGRHYLAVIRAVDEMVGTLLRFLDERAPADALHAPVDFFPTLCSLCGLNTPRTVEGFDNAAAWRGLAGAGEQDALFTMNFSRMHDNFADGWEWRGVRTRQHTYARRRPMRNVLLFRLRCIRLIVFLGDGVPR